MEHFVIFKNITLTFHLEQSVEGNEETYQLGLFQFKNENEILMDEIIFICESGDFLGWKQSSIFLFENENHIFLSNIYIQ